MKLFREPLLELGEYERIQENLRTLNVRCGSMAVWMLRKHIGWQALVRNIHLN